MPPTATLFLFVKGTASHEIEKLVADAQCAAALDTLEKIKTIPEVGEMVVATPSAEFAARVAQLGIHVENDPPDEGFHWGRCLAEFIEKYRADIPLYIGGGSGVLMSRDDWRGLVQRVIVEPNTVVTNNYFSSDFAAWSPGAAIRKFEPPIIDNELAFRLGENARLNVVPLPKNATTQLDIDTPTDLLTIAHHPGVGHHLRAFLQAQRLDTSRIERARSVFANRNALALISGRVSASMALFLERETACQWRILSEERGMRASGRAARGEVRSLLGFYLERVGMDEFTKTLSQLADAAIIDTRVLFSHCRLLPSTPDRFYSDLLAPEKIENPAIRDLTRAVREASIPILLGGHSLVSGGMYAMLEK